MFIKTYFCYQLTNDLTLDVQVQKCPISAENIIFKYRTHTNSAPGYYFQWEVLY